MPRGIEMKNPSSLTRNHEETVQHTKGERRHGEEVHRCDRVSVKGVFDEGRMHGSLVLLPDGGLFGRTLQDGKIGDDLGSILVVGATSTCGHL
jgi:hypothetical protein